MLRTIVAEYSLKFKKRTEDKHAALINTLDRLHSIKESLLCNNSHLSNLISIENVDADIYDTELLLEEVLVDKTRMLASKSRIKWLELGEKSNKYFLNINKSFQNKSYFKSFTVDGIEVSATKDKLNEVYKFYSELYSYHQVDEPDSYLSSVDINLFPTDHSKLYEPITFDELTKILKKCGNTAAGPDGIGYKLLKSCWGSYCNILISSWNYGLQTGNACPFS
jgi:hypothetical protein